MDSNFTVALPTPVAHPVRRLEEAATQALAQFARHAGLAHGLVHAGQPLVALQDADGKRHVAHLEAGMAELVGVVRRTAQPAAEKNLFF